MMNIFESSTKTDIRQLLKWSSIAFCAFDPMPTLLVKDYLGILISPSTKIVNKSLSLAVFPRSMKAALAKPLSLTYNIGSILLTKLIQTITYTA